MGELTHKPQCADSYGRSAALWGNFPLDQIFALKDRNVGIGLTDDFLRVGNTSLYDGYLRLATGSGSTLAQLTSEANAYGILRFTLDGDAANDEVVLQHGNGLDVGPFKLANYDLCFECRIRPNSYAIVANKNSFFVGLASGGPAGAGITDLLFTDSGGALYGTNSFVGFQRLYAESTALDAMYQKTGQTKVDGAVNTALNAIHTLVADEWVKLGFRYYANPKKLVFFVNGIPAIGTGGPAVLGAAALDAAAFPDDVFLTPTIGCKDVAGSSTDMTYDLDWWDCAQIVA